jgi:hypothetical protein
MIRFRPQGGGVHKADAMAESIARAGDGNGLLFVEETIITCR